MELLKWLQDWCKKQYENELGHIPEIKIYNIDNPGWVVKIDLSKTKFADILRVFKSWVSESHE